MKDMSRVGKAAAAAKVKLGGPWFDRLSSCWLLQPIGNVMV
jgi:hypothetical protein